MYKTFKIHEHDLKFYTKDIPAKQEKEKEIMIPQVNIMKP